MKFYKVWCSKCRKTTPQYVYQQRITRGAKLRCTECGNFKNRYTNFAILEAKSNE